MSAHTFSLVSDLLQYGVFTVLVVALGFFVAQFVLPGLRVGRELKAAHVAIAALKRDGPVLDLDRLAAQAMSGQAPAGPLLVRIPRHAAWPKACRRVRRLAGVQCRRLAGQPAQSRVPARQEASSPLPRMRAKSPNRDAVRAAARS